MDKLKELVFSTLFKRPVIEMTTAYPLKGKVIIVTGASKGLGSDMAKLALKNGARVVAVSRSLRDLKSLFQNADPSVLLPVEGDVTNQNACARIIDKALKKFGHIDVLVNNVGMYTGSVVEKIKVVDVNQAFSTNVMSGMYMAQAVAAHMKEHKSGSIIFIGSRISRNNAMNPGMSVYASTKFAVEGFATALSRELGSFGISVNCIMPGTMDTKRSVYAGSHLSSRSVAELVLFVIAHPDIVFESVVIRSLFHQT